MAKRPTNIAASVRVRLLNLARRTNQPFDVLLTRFVHERLLYRLSRSPHADRFVLKGAAARAGPSVDCLTLRLQGVMIGREKGVAIGSDLTAGSRVGETITAVHNAIRVCPAATAERQQGPRSIGNPA